MSKLTILGLSMHLYYITAILMMLVVKYVDGTEGTGVAVTSIICSAIPSIIMIVGAHLKRDKKDDEQQRKD